MAAGSKKKRNYAKEYLIRIARGLAGGKSRSQARGHSRAADLPSYVTPQPFKRSEPLEGALKLMKKGVSQKEAAKQAGVSAETLRRFQKANTASLREGHRWLIVDTRPVSVVMATRGKMRTVTVSHDASSDISRHWIAVTWSGHSESRCVEERPSMGICGVAGQDSWPRWWWSVKSRKQPDLSCSCSALP
jgi:hypothetical protein